MPSWADGKSALVTGATRGIGLVIARELLQRGARVALVARSHERLEDVTREIGGTPFALDLASESQVRRFAEQLERHFGDAPEIIVNAAGAFDLERVADTSVAAFDAMLASNLRAPFMLMRTFLPRMLQRGSGHIVSIGSVAGRQALVGNGAYSASKFGLRGLHEVLALELKGSGVRATLVEPAATDTPLWDPIDRTRNTELPLPAEMLPAQAVAECVMFALGAPQNQTVKYIGIERS
jgi:NAD(P)-dependent dehydrogenase (short-subunit alcohol dehydrogenase family)